MSTNRKRKKVCIEKLIDVDEATRGVETAPIQNEGLVKGKSKVEAIFPLPLPKFPLLFP